MVGGFGGVSLPWLWGGFVECEGGYDPVAPVVPSAGLDAGEGADGTVCAVCADEEAGVELFPVCEVDDGPLAEVEAVGFLAEGDLFDFGVVEG